MGGSLLTFLLLLAIANGLSIFKSMAIVLNFAKTNENCNNRITNNRINKLLFLIRTFLIRCMFYPIT